MLVVTGILLGRPVPNRQPVPNISARIGHRCSSIAVVLVDELIRCYCTSFENVRHGCWFLERREPYSKAKDAGLWTVPV